MARDALLSRDNYFKGDITLRLYLAPANFPDHFQRGDFQRPIPRGAQKIWLSPVLFLCGYLPPGLRSVFVGQTAEMPRILAASLRVLGSHQAVWVLFMQCFPSPLLLIYSIAEMPPSTAAAFNITPRQQRTFGICKTPNILLQGSRAI